MKEGKSYREFISGLIKDFFIIILLFASFYLIDIRTGAFAAVVFTTLLLTRRFILYLNPGFIKGYHIYYNKKELTVPQGVDVFDVSKVPSFKYLYKYTEVIRGILIPPRIFIIRFCGIFQLKEFELDMLKEVIRRLQSSKIIIILSDVEENVRYQLGECEIEKKVKIENVFYSVRDALLKANQLNEKKLDRLHPIRFSITILRFRRKLLSILAFTFAIRSTSSTIESSMLVFENEMSYLAIYVFVYSIIIKNW